MRPLSLIENTCFLANGDVEPVLDYALILLDEERMLIETRSEPRGERWNEGKLLL